MGNPLSAQGAKRLIITSGGTSRLRKRVCVAYEISTTREQRRGREVDKNVEMRNV
jgi:hypothetical protein